MKRTTVRLTEGLLERAKREAQRRGQTLTSLIEHGLALALAEEESRPRVRVEIPVSSAQGGTWPGIDLNHNAALLDLLE